MDISYCKKYEPVFGTWSISREIGSGKCGKVFEITRTDHGETYRAALKVVSIPEDSTEIARALSEGYLRESLSDYYRSLVNGLVAELDSVSQLELRGGIVGCFDRMAVQHEDGCGWDVLIRMEKLTPLSAYVRQNKMSTEEIKKLGTDICSALDICSERGIVHRNIKPENIFLSKGGYRLGDFGMGELTERANAAAPSWEAYAYTAPEVYGGSVCNTGTDCYSLGLVLYSLLNGGQLPFESEYIGDIYGRDKAIKRRLDGEALPSPADADEELAAVILKACAISSEDRFKSPTEFKRALINGLANEPAAEAEPPAQPTVVLPPEPKPEPPTVQTVKPPLPVKPTDGVKKEEPAAEKKNRRGLKTALIAALAVLLVGGGVFGLISMKNGAATQKEWSEWLESLPSGIKGSEYLIEEQTRYRSREKETMTADNGSGIDGWELEQTYDDGYGPWGDWSKKEIKATDDRKVESAVRYRSRSYETTTSSGDMPGWTLVNTTYSFGEYGEWSDWSYDVASGSPTRKVETKTVYSYRTAETKDSTEKNLSGWTLVDTDVEYGSWSDWTTEPISSSDTLDVEKKKVQTGEGYYLAHYCDGGTVASYRFSDECELHAYGWVDSLDEFEQVFDGVYDTGYYCPKYCSYYFVIDSDSSYETQYRSRTVKTTYHYEKWGEWSDYSETEQVASDTKEVRTKTQYRYCDRPGTPTYTYCRWSDWNEWTSTELKEDSTTQVESKTFYRSREKTDKPVYVYSRWSDWSSWSPEPIYPKDSYQIETKTFYRYRTK